MPEFYEYFRRRMLPQFPLWSKIVMQDLTIFGGERCKKYLQLPSTAASNIWVKNKMNASVENVFKIKKG